MSDHNASNSIPSISSSIHNDDQHTPQSSFPPLMLHLTLLRHGQTTANAMRIEQGHQPWPLNDIGIAQAKAAGLYLHDHYFCEVKAPMTMNTSNTESTSKINSEGNKEEMKHFFWRAYSSDLGRASTTAKIALMDATNNNEQSPSSSTVSPTPSASTISIESSLLKSNEKLRLDNRLREFAYGAREGKPVHLSYEEAEAEARKANEDIPLREFPEDVAARAKFFLEELYKDAIRELRQQEQSAIDHPSSHPLRVIIVSHGGFLRTLLNQVLDFDPELYGDKLQNGSITDVNVYYDYNMNDEIVVEDGGGNAKSIVDGCQNRLGKHVNYINHLKNLEIVVNESSKDPSLGDEK